MNNKGILYLCATPIGNLEDITYRAVRILKEADIIAAEDTRHTRKLLNHLNLHKTIVSYHEHNKFESGPKIITKLLAGQNVVLVSDAGMPGISDPGQELVKLCIENNIEIVPIPGPNAALCGLVCSGIDTEMFVFIGFLPRDKKKCCDILARVDKLPYTLIFYEAPHRLVKTLKLLNDVFGPRMAAACRELTKMHEQFIRGSLAELVEYFSSNLPRGEFTIVVAGSCDDGEVVEERDKQLLKPIDEAVNWYISQGLDKKAALRRVAQDRNISRREVYQAVIKAEKKEVQ